MYVGKGAACITPHEERYSAVHPKTQALLPKYHTTYQHSRPSKCSPCLVGRSIPLDKISADARVGLLSVVGCCGRVKACSADMIANRETFAVWNTDCN